MSIDRPIPAINIYVDNDHEHVNNRANMVPLKNKKKNSTNHLCPTLIDEGEDDNDDDTDDDNDDDEHASRSITGPSSIDDDTCLTRQQSKIGMNTLHDFLLFVVDMSKSCSNVNDKYHVVCLIHISTSILSGIDYVCSYINISRNDKNRSTLSLVGSRSHFFFLSLSLSSSHSSLSSSSVSV
jgi:hypothetical protein